MNLVKVVITLFAVFATYEVAEACIYILNQPSDTSWLFASMICVVSGFVIFLSLRKLWEKKEEKNG